MHRRRLVATIKAIALSVALRIADNWLTTSLHSFSSSINRRTPRTCPSFRLKRFFNQCIAYLSTVHRNIVTALFNTHMKLNSMDQIPKIGKMHIIGVDYVPWEQNAEFGGAIELFLRPEYNCLIYMDKLVFYSRGEMYYYESVL
jgi:hypothetical protein